jgi:hypothetical protein
MEASLLERNVSKEVSFLFVEDLIVGGKIKRAT